jgi:Flp pilus assembly protein TadB
MNRRVLQRVILSFVCALSLVLIPMSYSWAQSSTTDNQQDQTQTDRNADRQNQDVNQDMNQRQKPASEPNNMQNQSQTQPQTSEQKAGKSREGLSAAAGELPLLALIGVLSLAAAGSTRLFARAKSRR